MDDTSNTVFHVQECTEEGEFFGNQEEKHVVRRRLETIEIQREFEKEYVLIPLEFSAQVDLYRLSDKKSHTTGVTQSKEDEIMFEKLPIVIPRSLTKETTTQKRKKKPEFVPRKIPNAVSCPNLASMSGSLFDGTLDMDNPFSMTTTYQEQNNNAEEDALNSELFDPFAGLLPAKKIFKRAKLNKTVSCPDLSYMKATKAKILKEDERRKKRLARNRESARLRRLRKKTIVEHLQLETHALDEMMKKLKVDIMHAQRYNTHPSGPLGRQFDANVRPLISTFGLSNRTYKTSPYRRVKNMEYIMEESMAEVDMLEREIMFPLRVLEQVMGKNESNGTTKDIDGEEEEFDALDIIDRAKQMTMQSPQQKDEAFECQNDQQRAEIMSLSRAIDTEILMLKAIRKCFDHVQYKKWHVQETVDKWNENFLSVLSLEQAKKYLSWCRKNQGVISSSSIDVPKKGSFKK